MTEPVVDPLSATKDLLLAALDPVPGFAHELPDEAVVLMPRQCFVVSGAGGPGAGGFLPNARQRVDLKCYGATHDEAMDIAIAAHAELKAMRRTVVGAVLLRAFEPSSGFLTLRDGDARWALVLRSYLLSYDERAVA